MAIIFYPILSSNTFKAPYPSKSIKLIKSTGFIPVPQRKTNLNKRYKIYVCVCWGLVGKN